VLAEETVESQETHAKHLMGMIDSVVGSSGSTIAGLDGFAVTRGPGSFTGLRIGIAAIKGLASAANRPVVGVSTLDALAAQVDSPTMLICPLLDARRHEVYYSRYRIEDGHLRQLMEERVSDPAEAIATIDELCVFVGNGAALYRETIAETLGNLAEFAPAEQHTIRASTVANLSISRFELGRTDDLSRFAPVYIRKSDAEINRLIEPDLRKMRGNS